MVRFASLAHAVPGRLPERKGVLYQLLASWEPCARPRNGLAMALPIKTRPSKVNGPDDARHALFCSLVLCEGGNTQMHAQVAG